MRGAADANTNGGDGDTDLLMLRRTGDGFQHFQPVCAPSGAADGSVLYEWSGSGFQPRQRFPPSLPSSGSTSPLAFKHFRQTREP